jgi:Matrixin
LFSNDKANAAAVTRVFRNKQKQIIEADIVLNPVQQFSVDGSIGTFDLEKVFTHEIGHLIGLDHSLIPSSVMFEDVQKNGLFGHRAVKGLAKVDVSNAIALYGPRDPDLAECSNVAGRLVNKNSQGITVTVHNSLNGKLIFASETDKNGLYSIPCLSNGSYELSASTKRGGLMSMADLPIQRVNIEGIESTIPVRQASFKRIDFDVTAMGRDGRIDGGAIVFSPGESFNALISGPDIARRPLRFTSSSSLITIRTLENVSTEFETENDVLRVEIRSSVSISPGEYSLIAEDEHGSRRYVFGVFIVQ